MGILTMVALVVAAWIVLAGCLAVVLGRGIRQADRAASSLAVRPPLRPSTEIALQHAA